jgi:formylglycine-generating enzyme required for sulfatase activity
LTVTSIPSGLAYTVKNVAGFAQSGTTPCDIADVPSGEIAVVVTRKDWPVIEQSVRVPEGGTEIVAAEFAAGSLTVCSEPTGAEVWESGKQLGVTPLRLDGLIPGTHSYELRLKGYDKRVVSGQVRAHEVGAISQALVRFLGPKEGESFIIPDLKLGLVPIAAGSFEMGDWSDETTTLHKVTLSQGYWLGRTEVTQGQFSAVMHSGPSHYRGDNNLPVECVSWDDASNFCRKLTERERAAGRLPDGYTYCLPTEAQWEYACRAGGKDESGGGKGLGDMAWYGGKSGYSTHPVGQKRANAWGLYDMYGNVAEWCADRYGNYPSGAVINPTGSARGYSRVVRGGNSGSSASVCTSTHRSSFAPRFFQSNIGFRVALSSGTRSGD